MTLLAIAITPNPSSSNRYDYTQVFKIENLLASKGYNRNDSFFCVTSENFLSKTSNSTQIGSLSAQEFSIANNELFRCSTIYRAAKFIGHSFVTTENPSFLEQFSNHLSNWSLLADTTLSPYLTTMPSGVTEEGTTKSRKIRNTASNFGAAPGQLYQYSISTHFQDSLSRSQLKGMYLGNYHQSAYDVLNLNMPSDDYRQSIAAEHTGPYYANGSFDPLTSLSESDYFSMIGQDALHLWDTSRVAEYLGDTVLQDAPLIIQSDPFGVAVNQRKGWKYEKSVVTPGNFFNALTFVSTGDEAYPDDFTVSSTTSSPAHSLLLDFLKAVPYILFVGCTPIFGTGSNVTSAIYCYDNICGKFYRNKARLNGTLTTVNPSTPFSLTNSTGAQYILFTY